MIIIGIEHRECPLGCGRTAYIFHTDEKTSYVIHSDNFHKLLVETAKLEAE